MQADPVIASMGNIGPNIPSMSDMVGSQIAAANAPLMLQPPPSQQSAAQPVAAAPNQSGNPAVGEVRNGYIFQGGNRKDPSAWTPATGDAFLNSLPLPDDKKTLIKMMTAYDAPASGSRGIGSPEVQQLVGLAKQYDPTFDIKQYKVRQDYLHDLNDQKANGTVQALNNAALHAKSFDDEYQKLNNSNYLPAWANRSLDYIGSKATQTAAGAANETKAVLAPEIARVAQGGSPTVDEVNRQVDNFDIGTRPNIESGTVASAAQKIGDRLMSMQAQQRRAFGNEPMKEPILSPEAAMATHQLLSRYAPDYENKLDLNLLSAGGFNQAQAAAIQSPAPAAQASPAPTATPQAGAPQQTRVIGNQKFIQQNGQWYHQ